MSCYCQKCATGKICDSWDVVENKKSNERTDNETPSSSIESYATGDYIAVNYEGSWYVGQIREADNDSNSFDYNVTFMQRRKGLFQWQSREDSVWRKKSHIICKVNPMVASGKSKRMYKLEKSEEDKIEKLFQLIG